MQETSPFFSIIVPVYNRPDELRELLASLSEQSCAAPFEVIVIDDGSTVDCRSVVATSPACLSLRYAYQENAGPAAARNRGAKLSNGKYLIFLDSDCVCPPHYLNSVFRFLSARPVDAFGGPDAAHPDFTPTQKAINYAMTSSLTTGGIRGGKNYASHRFLPRSFNMGVKRTAFEQVNGFDERMRFGEDIDLSLRLRGAGFQSALVSDAWVYHKRRVKWRAFFKQIYNSGMARIYLSEKHPGSLQAIHLLPTAFALAMPLCLVLCFQHVVFALPVAGIATAWFVDALWHYRYPPRVAFLAIWASAVQLTAYGMGFLHAFVWRTLLRRPPRHAFVKRFYR